MFKVQGSGLAPGACRPLIGDESFARMKNEEECPPSPSLLVTSHQSRATHPCFQTFGDIPFPYRHRKRSRGIFLALRSVSHRHWQGNDALVLRISAFAHPSFIGLQRRFLACARNDDTRESLVPPAPLIPSHKSLATNPCFQTFGDIPFPYRHRKRSRGIFLALRSVSHRHWQGNDALVLRISAFAHPSFIGLQRRFLACARNDDTRESLVTSHQSPVTSPLRSSRSPPAGLR